MFEHPHAFDPTYGHDLPALLRVGSPAPPADFADFWQTRYARALAVQPDLDMREVSLAGYEKYRVFEVEYSSLDGFRVGGWVTVPRELEPRRIMVVGHGYGGRGAPEPKLPGPPAAAIYPCARGFNRSARPDLPDTANVHVLHGIEDRDSYLNGYCAADLWAAGSAMLAWLPQLAGRLDYLGVSFGGGLGALMLPWDGRYRRAYLEVPTFGNHPLRVTLPCVGSGEAVRLLHQRRPGVLDVLAYFDAAAAARFMRLPVMVGAAKFDPSVPPPGQFAVYNALAGPRQLLVQQAGHFDHPQALGEAVMTFNTVSAWFWQA
jgi:cephalosporin-C deacetylase